jgi:hypothetical protein
MVRATALTLGLLIVMGCASSPPPPPVPTPRLAHEVRRLAIVPAGDGKFVVLHHRAEPGRTFDEVVKWTPHQWLRPLGALVQSGINWLFDSGQAATMAPDIAGVTPRLVVTEAVSRRLRASGLYPEVRTLEHEPLGAERQSTDALLRVSVVSWGLVRVGQGSPDLLSAFADVRGQITLPGIGVVAWEINEDVTHLERLTVESFARDSRLMRHQLIEVLDQAGERLASELLYARGAAP